MAKRKYPCEIVFYPSATQDPSQVTAVRMETAQRYLFRQRAGTNDDAEIRVFDLATGNVISCYFYRMAKSGQWKLTRVLIAMGR